MRKVFLHINMSLDGYIEDQEREMDWHFVDATFEEYINEMLHSIDGMIFGRAAHQLLAGYWPGAGSDPAASPRHVEAARMMNALPKYVVTRGPYESAWENTHVISSDVAGRIRALKEQPGRDIALFAGAGAAQSLMEMGLVDEYRIIVNPALLGGGTPLFAPRAGRVKLRLLGTRTFASGGVVLYYAPAE